MNEQTIYYTYDDTIIVDTGNTEVITICPNCSLIRILTHVTPSMSIFFRCINCQTRIILTKAKIIDIILDK